MLTGLLRIAERIDSRLLLLLLLLLFASVDEAEVGEDDVVDIPRSWLFPGLVLSRVC